MYNNGYVLFEIMFNFFIFVNFFEKVVFENVC